MADYKAPGVYIEELDGGSKPIAGASTAVAAFVGFTSKAPEDNPEDPEGLTPRKINNWTQFETLYGGFADNRVGAEGAYKYLMTPHAVFGWFNNGGTAAYIVRVPHLRGEGDAASAASAPAAESTGDSGAAASSGGRKGRGAGAAEASDEAPADAPEGAADGTENLRSVGPGDFIGSASERTGIAGLIVAEDATMVMAPDLETAFGEDLISFQAVQDAMLTHCSNMKNSMAILDSPRGMSPARIKDWRENTASYSNAYAALYYPWIKIANPNFKPNTDQAPMLTAPPSGHIAGVWARNDATRGPWKSPANEVVRGALALESKITSLDQEDLNPIGINCIRPFGSEGIRIWGARTLSPEADQWRYVAVRRLFNYVESSILSGTSWVVFEPNDQPLWARVSRTVSAFLTGLWRNGGLAGATPEQAFYVKCDEETNPQDSIDNGNLICEIGMAPLKPAEFVVFRISQWHPGA